MTVTAEPVEGEIVEPTTLSIRPSRAVADWEPNLAEEAVERAVAQVEMRERFMKKVMRPDFDYGVIPGTGTKPTLLKPGAERLLSAYGLHAELSDESPPVIDFDSGLFLFRRQCRIYRQTGPSENDRVKVAQASGTCSSFESKYRWRKGERVCPECGKPTIIKGKAEYGGGWLCFAKKGGCGAKFPDNAAVITTQSTERVLNPDMADVLNTVEKMTDKRALIAATIIATGWSDMVTQDLEAPDDDGAEAAPSAPRSKPPAPRRRAAPPPPPADPGDMNAAELADHALRRFLELQKLDKPAAHQAFSDFGWDGQQRWAEFVARLDTGQRAELVATLDEAIANLDTEIPG